MAFDKEVAERVRYYLSGIPGLSVTEKKMFGGLAFLVNGKMCINVSSGNLMCRFDPAITEEVASKKGYQPLTMRGKLYQGYCYVDPTGFRSGRDFEFWMNLCLDFNKTTKKSGKKTRGQR